MKRQLTSDFSVSTVHNDGSSQADPEHPGEQPGPKEPVWPRGQRAAAGGVPGRPEERPGPGLPAMGL